MRQAEAAEKVSIHAPNEGSDVTNGATGGRAVFQSTLPMKGATCPFWLLR